MTSFDWRMSPEEFVRDLNDRGRLMRRIAGGTIGGKRHVKSVQRRRRKWYRSLNGHAELPRMESTLERDRWTFEPAGSMQILIPSDGIASQENGRTGDTPTGLRKDMRRLLHAAVKGGLGRPFALVNSRRGRSRLPAIGRRPDGPQPEVRALYLEAMGVAIVPSLTELETKALMEAGAIVVPNELITIEEPVAAGGGTAQPADSHLTSIDIASARAAGLTGKGVRIGVLDTGIDASHPEFADRQVEYMAFKASGEKRPIKPRDFDSHGTHVAALCVGKTVGVAPGADLAVAAVITERNPEGKMAGFLAQILAGMDWLAGGGGQIDPVDLINASLGSPTSAKGYGNSIESYRLQGILTIAAIGNNGRSGMGFHCAPAMLDSALGVGAVDNNGRVADFSDWGLCHADPASTEYKPDMMAPGVGVRSAVPGRRYERKNGTSMACPIVAGAAALLIEHDGLLRNEPDALTRRLFQLTQPLPKQPSGFDVRRGGRGRLVLTSIAI